MSRPLSDRVSRSMKRPGPGRPTREQSQRRQDELLDKALEAFLEKGFELATIEAIAASVGMTKRTVYAKYSDKRTLFSAAIHRAIDRWTIPLDAIEATEKGNLEQTLTAIARVRMANALSPAGLRLQRILNTESYRFPEIQQQAYEQGLLPTIDFLANVLRRHSESGAIHVDQPVLAATTFLTMAVSIPSRVAAWGHPVGETEREDRIRFCVRLFLDGARPRAEDVARTS